MEERAKSQFFEKVHEEVVLKTQEAAKEKEFQSVPAGPAGAVEVIEMVLNSLSGSVPHILLSHQQLCFIPGFYLRFLS